MDNEKFYKWLISNKNMTERSASDVLSRYNRIKKLTKNDVRMETLINNKEFKNLNMCVKSQLKRALILLCEYEEGKNETI